MTWTGYYGPNPDEDKSGFKTYEDAQAYAESRTDLDTEAWMFLKTGYYLKCEGFRDILAAAGYYPIGKDQGIDMDRFPEYLERCRRLSMPDSEIVV